MRVTESRMMQQSAEAVSRQREKAAEAGEQLQTGIRVARPSQDISSYAEGARLRARNVMSDARGEAIGRSRDRLSEADRAFAGIGDVLSRAQELATQLSNFTYSAQERTTAMNELRDLRAQAVAFANTVGPDGAYVLAGSTAGTAPFDAAGVYSGDAVRREIESAEGGRSVIDVPGSVLTAAGGGIDVFATITSVETALAANDVAALRATLTPITTAIGQVATARSDVGERMSALEGADDARLTFELELAKQHERAVGADPVQVASELAQAQSAFETSRTVAQQIIAMFRRA